MDEIDVRVWALDRAIKEAPSGTIWENIFALADKYTRYILNGTWATPVEDAKADDTAEHDFTTDNRRPIPRCIICRKTYEDGTHK